MKIFLSPKIFLVLAVLASTLALSSGTILVLDRLAMDETTEEDDVADGAVFSLGSEVKDALAGMTYYSPPEFTMCPASDGVWDGRFTWLIVHQHEGAPPGTTIAGPDGPSISIVLPPSAREVKKFELKAQSEIPEREFVGVPFTTSSEPTVQKKGGRTVAKVVLGASTQGVLEQGKVTHIVSLSFRFDAPTTTASGLGRKRFVASYVADLADRLGLLSVGTLGASETTTSDSKKTDDRPDLIEFTICNDKASRFSQLLPAAEDTDSRRRLVWKIDAYSSGTIRGEVSSPFMRAVVGNASTIFTNTIFAAIGAIYGIAFDQRRKAAATVPQVFTSTQKPDSGKSTKAPNGQNGRRRRRKKRN